MTNSINQEKVCVVIGASHAGVNFAFSLRRLGWDGSIVLYDSDATLPYHRPALSKSYLTNGDSIEQHRLKTAQAYEDENIELRLGTGVLSINRDEKRLILNDGTSQKYDKLVLAVGSSPVVPNILGLDAVSNVFTLRTADDAFKIKSSILSQQDASVVVIGGGYIGLEIAASLKKLGAKVTILEREERILARVTSPELSQYFMDLHSSHEVDILTNKNAVSISESGNSSMIECQDGSKYDATMIIVGVGIRVNDFLARSCGLDIDNGIKVNEAAQTNDPDIYAIGDCTNHYNLHYGRWIRLESVQNAVDQAKVAAANISGKNAVYNSVPWFWSDQYYVKLQIVGMETGYNEVIAREESEDSKFSCWFFKDEELLAVHAINNAKAYVIGTKFIKERKAVNKKKLKDASIDLKSVHLLSQPN